MSAAVVDGVYVSPVWSSELRNLYWHVRYHGSRNPSVVRKLYRRIYKEKCALVRSGVNREHVRLVCLWLADPSRENRCSRLVDFERKRGSFSLVAPCVITSLITHKRVFPSAQLSGSAAALTAVFP